MTPSLLWERVNAVDSSGYVVATILGPPLAAGAVAVLGPQAAIALIAIPFLAAVIALIGVPEPAHSSDTSGRLLADAWQGVKYTWHNRTLRGLGFSVSVLGLASGGLAIVIPLVVLDSLGLDEGAVGLVWAASGVSGMVGAIWLGRHDTHGRERWLIAGSMLAMAPGFALLLPASGVPFTVTVGVGLGLAVLTMLIYGVFDGMFGVAMFTLRQRRTDPAWLGRAFAVSMAFNFMGYPIGAAIAGVVAAVSLTAAIGLEVLACVVAGVLTLWLVPRAAAEYGSMAETVAADGSGGGSGGETQAA